MTDYVTLQEFKDYYDPRGEESWSAADEEQLSLLIAAVCEWVEDETGRVFAQPTADATLYYTAQNSKEVWIDNLLSLTTLKTDEDGDGTYEVDWTDSDYILLPRNGPAYGDPYQAIKVNPNGDYGFPTLEFAVEVTGKFASTTTPPKRVKAAVLLMVHRLWARRESILGISGTTELGVTIVKSKIDKDGDIMALLEHLPGERTYG